IAAGAPPAGIEYYLPLFFDETATLLDYLPANTVIAAPTGVTALAEQAFADIEARDEQRRHDRDRPVLAPAELFMPPAEVAERLAGFRLLEISRVELDPLTEPLPHRNFATRPPPRLPIDPRAEEPARELAGFFREFCAQAGGRALIAAESAGRREMLLDILRRQHVTPTPVERWSDFMAGDSPIAITVSPIVTGLLLETPRIALIAEEQLFGERVRQERRRRRPERDPEK